MPNLLKNLTAALPSSARPKTLDDTQERLAVAVRQGLDAYDTWQTAQPILFYGGMVGAAASGYMLWRRRKTPEAYPLYGTLLAASLAAVWFGRPQRPAPAAPGAPAPSTGIVGWLDAKRAAYRAQDPAWAAKTWARLRAQPDVNQMISGAPVLQAVIP